MTFRRLDLDDPALPGAFGRPAVTVGVFDGVHLGHAALLDRLVASARAAGVAPVVVTFWPHPRAVLGGGAPPLITTLAHRVALLRRRGAAGVVVLPFDADVASWPAEVFAERVLAERLAASRVVLGADHRFGRGRRGDVALLARLGERLGFVAEAVPLVETGGVKASSTAVRDALRRGDLDLAGRLLGRPVSVLGHVVRGDQRGRALGFPTANLDLGAALRPPRGVYAVRARTVVRHEDGPLLPAVANVGRRPTFTADEQDLVEVHLLEGGRDLYGLDLEVEFVERLRDERRFEGVDALRAQIARDAARAREVLGA
ncbi:MAG: bifunctional riboflavin kinase/FAD synthetase [Planctomycetes bacterium]|nr:bifunctional riboflavin kinase/FAD synthetase [Planctomycetota bacterium]